MNESLMGLERHEGE